MEKHEVREAMEALMTSVSELTEKLDHEVYVETSLRLQRVAHALGMGEGRHPAELREVAHADEAPDEAPDEAEAQA